ncbi:MAG: site-specific DNA-methyltransferase [Verrucomicrobia bacterium]|nr:site-specific DNA-methyltransferase [Verrucomicrobiota bacterium]
MPTLNWIGKEAVVNHHHQVPFHLLKDVPELACGDPGSGNLIVQGDNLVALKALLPFYAGQVKCIYIDPPYNTGVDERDEKGTRTGWRYSDNVNSAEIREWLGKVVGAEAEDLSRHEKWLCMMYPRLALLKKFLKEDGVLFASIDENEFPSLRLILDELFGATNRAGTIVWKNVTDNNPTNIAIEHEYVLCYAKNKARLPSEWKSTNLAVKTKLLELGEQFIGEFKEPDQRQEQYSKWFRKNKEFLWPFDRYKFIDDGGIFTGSQSVHNPGKEGYRYDILHPVTGKPCAEPMMGYRFPKETAERLREQGRIIFGDDETKIIELKLYVKDYRAKLSSLFELDGRIGTNEIKEIFPDDKRPFDFPKPTDLIEELLSFTTSGDDLILDSFAGSGTTGHAVLKLNKADNQKRRFVLLEMKPQIARDITRERVKRVAEGYANAKGEQVEGLSGGFRFCELGEPLFDERGQIKPSVRFADLARHVYFTETGEPLPDKVGRVTPCAPSSADTQRRARSDAPYSKSPLLGICRGVGIYLLFNGILGDKSANGGNILTRGVLAQLPKFDGQKVIYCAGCLLGKDRLQSERIIVRQTPYEIKVS